MWCAGRRRQPELASVALKDRGKACCLGATGAAVYKAREAAAARRERLVGVTAASYKTGSATMWFDCSSTVAELRVR